jgi:malate dehydrogenase (oxaloacetate-decarboxylating)
MGRTGIVPRRHHGPGSAEPWGGRGRRTAHRSGLFVDEVGKFITQKNDYFLPLAAPIVYASLLLILVPSSLNARVRDQRYDELIDAYVTTTTKLFPNAMLALEDFGVSNARRILNEYADQVCTFNDDMQGTAAVVLAAAFAAVRAAGSRMRDQRLVIHGAGTAGIGIADMMSDVMVREGLTREEATRRFYALDRDGLITDDRVATLRDFQVPYARPAGEVANWSRPQGDGITLADVVANSEPTMLIGTSTQSAAFSEQIVKQMASKVERPIIMPLSNPTSRSACRAIDSSRTAWSPQ